MSHDKSSPFKTAPRQKLCWDFYIDPSSPTFSNAKQSAIRAGYDDSYAEHIKQADWFCGNLRRFAMNDRAEAALHEILSIPIQFVDTGDKNAPLAVLTDPALIKIKQDVAKFVVERLCPEAWSPQRRMRVRINAQHPTVDPAKKALGDELIRSYLNQEHCECCSNKKTFAA